MPHRILVTGATGFVGSHILDELQKLSNVTVVVSCRNPKLISPGFNGEIRAGDLRDQSYVKNLVADIDTICHAAAWTSLWKHRQASEKLFLQPARFFMHAAKAAGVKRFVHTSSTSAASPHASADAMSPGTELPYWPHMSNVIKLENELRALADESFSVINLRLGIFAGKHYGLGILPILLPRLKTHLVPWVKGGQTSLPIIDGRDIGQAFAKAAETPGLVGYESFNIVGPEIPTVKQVVSFLHQQYAYPLPHFSVPFWQAYAFAWLMEKLDPIVPWEPLITRSIVHLLEEVNVDNQRAQRLLNYHPKYHWQDAVALQVEEMHQNQQKAMSMAIPVR